MFNILLAKQNAIVICILRAYYYLICTAPLCLIYSKPSSSTSRTYVRRKEWCVGRALVTVGPTSPSPVTSVSLLLPSLNNFKKTKIISLNYFGDQFYVKFLWFTAWYRWPDNFTSSNDLAKLQEIEFLSLL